MMRYLRTWSPTMSPPPERPPQDTDDVPRRGSGAATTVFIPATPRQLQWSAEGGCHAADGLGEHGLAGAKVHPHEPASWGAEAGTGFECDAAAVEEQIAWLLAVSDAPAVQPGEVGCLRWLP